MHGWPWILFDYPLSALRHIDVLPFVFPTYRMLAPTKSALCSSVSQKAILETLVRCNIHCYAPLLFLPMSCQAIGLESTA